MIEGLYVYFLTSPYVMFFIPFPLAALMIEARSLSSGDVFTEPNRLRFRTGLVPEAAEELSSLTPLTLIGEYRLPFPNTIRSKSLPRDARRE